MDSIRCVCAFAAAARGKCSCALLLPQPRCVAYFAQHCCRTLALCLLVVVVVIVVMLFVVDDMVRSLLLSKSLLAAACIPITSIALLGLQRMLRFVVIIVNFSNFDYVDNGCVCCCYYLYSFYFFRYLFILNFCGFFLNFFFLNFSFIFVNLLYFLLFS